MQFSQSLTRVASVQSSPRAFWISEKLFPQLRTFSNEQIHVEGKIQSPITSNGWPFDSATFTVVADGLKSLIDRDLFDQLGLAVTQSTSLKDDLINNISSLSEFKEQITKTNHNKNHKYLALEDVKLILLNLHSTKTFNLDIKKRDLFRLICKIKSISNFRNYYTKKQIMKFSSCPDKNFISPIVVTIRKDQTIKLALISKTLNKANHKNKYQMPNIDTLIESIPQKISAPVSQNTTHFSTLDLKYAYSQLNLDTNHSKPL